MTPRLARDIMSRDVVTVFDDTPVAEAARLFHERRISGAPVVDRKNRLVGVVSTFDIVSNELKVGHEVVSELDYYTRPLAGSERELSRLGLHVEDYTDSLVRDIMTPVAISAPLDATVDELADIMGTNRIHRLLITEDERLVGVVSALDLVGLIPTRRRPGREEKREVLFATDLGPDAERVGEQALAIARDLGASLTVLHVTPDLGSLLQAYGQRPELQVVQQGFEELALERLQDLTRRLVPEAFGFDIVARSGDPAAVILRAIEERRPDYVVIGAQRPERERLAGLGSVAAKVLVHSQTPVLTVVRPT
jgi:CBS domain-containing protein/nucleotide-binding universal stress UspA family protein